MINLSRYLLVLCMIFILSFSAYAATQPYPGGKKLATSNPAGVVPVNQPSHELRYVVYYGDMSVDADEDGMIDWAENVKNGLTHVNEPFVINLTLYTSGADQQHPLHFEVGDNSKPAIITTNSGKIAFYNSNGEYVDLYANAFITTDVGGGSVPDPSDYVMLRVNNPDDYSELVWGDDTVNRFRFYYDDKSGTTLDREVMTLFPNGNVTIGGGSSNAIFHINASIRGSNEAGSIKILTDNGYTKIGALNPYWSHFYTDRPKYYFDKPISVDGELISSYKQDLVLRAAAGQYNVVSGTDGPTAAEPTKNQLYLSSGGNIGIGTVATAHKLTVNGWIEEQGTDFLLGTNDGRSVGTKTLQRALVHWDNDWLVVNFDGDFEAGTRIGGDMDTADGLFVMNDGKVGIGVWAPSSKLHVSGVGFGGGAGMFESRDHANYISIRGKDGAGVNDVAFIGFQNSAVSPVPNTFIGITGTNAAPVGDLRFAVNDIEAMRISAVGDTKIPYGRSLSIGNVNIVTVNSDPTSSRIDLMGQVSAGRVVASGDVCNSVTCLSTLKTQFDTLSSTVSSLSSRVGSLESRVSALETPPAPVCIVSNSGGLSTCRQECQGMSSAPFCLGGAGSIGENCDESRIGGYPDCLCSSVATVGSGCDYSNAVPG